MWGSWILFGLLFIALIGLAAWYYRRDRRREHGRVREVLSDEVKQEIEAERQAALQRKHHFEDVLHRSDKKPPRTP